LIDCRLLAEVYLHLTGGRQPGLAFQAGAGGDAGTVEKTQAANLFRPPRPHAPTPEELAAHKAFIAGLKDPVWLD
ncbi:MAG: DNA polymerase III subunit epsilon, partial [Alphaproteobacteria bacterium]|nr:DNA polymerase III subunit epsilon [Alphaproteobacteria bacterium]